MRNHHQTREEIQEDLYRRFSRRGLRRQQRRRAILGMSVPLLNLIFSGAKRALDVLAAGSLLLLLAPLLFTMFLLAGGKLHRTARAGRWCEPFDQFSLALPDGGFSRMAVRLRLPLLPVLINIFRGQMSFVGPRPVSPEELSPRERAARKRFSVRPGLISVWWIRRQANIAFDNEVQSDGEYVDTQSIRGDLGIALRAIPAAFYGDSAVAAAETVKILGISINNLTMSETVENIISRLRGNRAHGGSQICFVNADCANLAHKDAEYREILNQAEMTLADGIGLKLAGKLLARDIKQNVNGTDLFPRLCAALSGTGQGLFLLGAKPGVAEQVRDWIQQHHPAVTVSGCHHGYFSLAEEPEVIRQIAGSGASLLLVAFGAPRQDKWIHQHLNETGVQAAMGVGGLFDFYSGNISRAPQWLRELGMEWFYRFLQEPRRMWKRYFVGNALFLFRVFKERNKQSSPVA
jgi:N-acetylglucosaminyldiphosphoundecaprenol N-acetyl-beta-D-mannosaminyltransferase